MATVMVGGGAGGDQGPDVLAAAFQQVVLGLARIQEAVSQQERRMQDSIRQQETRMQELMQQQVTRMQELLRQQEIGVQESLQQQENRMQVVVRQKIQEIMAQHERSPRVAARQEEMMQLEGMEPEGNASTESLQRVEEESAVEDQSPSSGVHERGVGGRVALGHLEGRMTKLEAAVQRALETVFPRVEALVAQLEKPSPPAAPPAPMSISPTAGASASPSSSTASASRSSVPRRRFRVTFPSRPSTSNHPLLPGPSARRDALDRELLNAAVEGRIDDVQRLLDAGADVNCRGSMGTTPLMDAALNAHAGVLGLLVSRGADVNLRSDVGMTALHFAACDGRRSRCVFMLTQVGAPVDCWDDDGRTPLHYAALRGKEKAALALLAAGATKHVTDNRGRTPFECADIEALRRFLR